MAQDERCPNCGENDPEIFDGKTCSLPNWGCGWPDPEKMKLAKELETKDFMVVPARILRASHHS